MVYLQYYLLGIIKVAFLIWGVPTLLGIVLGLVKKKESKPAALWIGLGFYSLIEIVVLIEKGRLFFFRNLYFMISLSPKTWLEWVLGVGLGAAWAYFCVRFVSNGARTGSKLRSHFSSSGKAS